MDILNEVTTTREAAIELKINDAVLRRACDDGRLPARKAAGTWLFLWEDVREFARNLPRRKRRQE